MDLLLKEIAKLCYRLNKIYFSFFIRIAIPLLLKDYLQNSKED
jgi:hypothetical protein